MIKKGYWSVSFNIVMDGNDVIFESLDEWTQDYILKQIKNEYYSGEIIEEIDE